MDKYYSYTDFLRALSQQTNINEGEKLLNDIYLDLFLNRLLRLQRIEQLHELIDQSLQHKKREQFMALTEELKMLQQEDAF